MRQLLSQPFVDEIGSSLEQPEVTHASYGGEIRVLTQVVWSQHWYFDSLLHTTTTHVSRAEQT